MNISDIKYGLFKYEVKDYYSILGAPINADAKQIRMRYLQIAKQLHPDTSVTETSQEKDKATQILSKLVNPAYENLYKDKPRKECQLILSDVGRRLATDAYQITIATDTAKKLFQEEKNLDNLYQEMISKLAAGLYVDVNTVIKKISLLSELNMVYLMRKKQLEYQQAEGGSFSSSYSIFNVQQTEPSINKVTVTNNENQSSSSNQNQKEPVQSGINEKGKTTDTSAKVNPPNKNERLMQSALHHQQEGNIEQGIIDLREALKLDPNDASCHALIGSLYLKQGNLAYAKIHIKKGADLDKNNARVKESQQELKEIESKDKKQNQKSSSSTKSKAKDTKDKAKSSSSTNKSKPKETKGKGKDEKGNGKDEKGKKEAPKIFGIPLW